MTRQRLSQSSSPPRWPSQTRGMEGFYRTAANSTSSVLPPRPNPAAASSEAAITATSPRGSLMAPHELGIATASSAVSEEEHSAVAASACPAILRAQQRALRSIARHQTYESQVQEEILRQQERENNDGLDEAALRQREETFRQSLSPPLSRALKLTYRGMSIILGTTDHPSVYVICPKTQLVYQELALAESNDSSPIVALKAHPTTGQVVVVQENGCVQSFLPQPVDPTQTCYGRYQWVPQYYTSAMSIGATTSWQQTITSSNNLQSLSIVLDAHSFFYDHNDSADWLVSLSFDYKVLVARGQQLVVLDTAPFTSLSPRASSPNNNNTVVWMSRLPGTIIAAQLSGDACAMAVVCRSEERETGANDDGDYYGVHTWERDWEDGSERDWSLSNSRHSSRRRTESDATPALDTAEATPPLARSRSVGVVYKPGPFLVHPSPVTRLSFRGQGHNTSSAYGPHSVSPQGNDLLLTYCEDSLSARIFCQNGWKCLMEWDTPMRTRVDWIHGVSAFTLGDLEPKSSSSKHRSAPSSRRPSLTKTNEANDVGSSKRQHYQSIPNHATPYSNAGAWISEITFQNATPAIRLSRLTYMKRGVDEFSPTLFENVSALLPVGMISPSILCGHDDSFLSVEGTWPAWNPRMTDASNAGVVENHTETLRGSAMSFLGLASGPTVAAAGAGGTFSDGSLSNTQSPPCDVSIVFPNAQAGKLVSLEFPMLGDQDWTALELGNPTRSIMLLSEMDVIAGKKRVVDRIPLSTAMEIELGQLIAKHEEADSNVISVSFRKHGPPMFLPAHWMPEDVDPEKAVKVFSDRRWFKDETLFPVPLEFPSVTLPCDVCDKQSVVEMRWWADDNFGGPPILVVVLSNGTVVLFEIPPPWSFGQPVALRKNVLFPESPIIKVNTMSSYVGELYEVSIVPHSEFGLGLRLEVQQDGNPAIAGSFKRNPVSGDILPAEQTNLICLGDELVSANGVNLEEKMFDDIIATVRDIGAISGVGNPMRLVFRRMSDQPVPPASPPRHSRPVDQVSASQTMATTLMAEGDQPSLVESIDDRVHCLPEHYNVVALFGHAIPEFCSQGTKSELALIPCKSDTNSSNGGLERSCVLYYSSGCDVSAVLVELHSSRQREMARLSSVGTWRKSENGHSQIMKMCVKNLDKERTVLVLCDAQGLVTFVHASLDREAAPLLHFRHLDLFHLETESLRNVTLRLYDATLIGTMLKGDSGFSEEIIIWSSRPDPYGSDVENGSTTLERSCYTAYSIRAELLSANYGYFDFEFVNSGYLDSSPALFACSGDHVTVYSKQGGDWLPSIRMTYTLLSNALPVFEVGSVSTHRIRESPRLTFSRQVRAMLCAYKSEDEENLYADWHPASMVASVLVHEGGPIAALRERIRPLLLWLSSDAMDIPDDHLAGRLYATPIAALFDTDKSRRNLETTASRNSESASDSSRTIPVPAGVDNEKIGKLHRTLLAHCRAKDGMLGEDSELPPILLSSSRADLHILRGFCELLLDAPTGPSNDICAEHFIVSVRLIKTLHSLRSQEPKNVLAPSPFAIPGISPRSRVVVGDIEWDSRRIPSAACLAAFLSSSQTRLIDFCKRSDDNFDWSAAKSLRMPFWVRSDTALARVSEELGQNSFRSERDVMEAALFFIIANKKTTLRNLAAADPTEKGRKFYKFLCSFDFSTERGRRAAEKNAFSLLRKCKYRAASAFFLLAEPPFIGAAVETLATKLRDLDLAFMVSRLMESDEVKSATAGGTFSALGGGGGYASFSAPDPMATTDVGYKNWTPSLKKSSWKLLVERSIPATSDDCLLCAVQLLWLGKKDDAGWVTTGLVRPTDLSTVETHDILDRLRTIGTGKDHVVLATRRLCALVDSLSAPLLLKSMASNQRQCEAAVLSISSALQAIGVEIPAIELSQRFVCTDGADEETDVKRSTGPKHASSAPVNSSIFDAFDLPQGQKKGAISEISTVAPQSQATKPAPSIFDAFDVPVPVKKPAPAQIQPEMSSSIFDSFDMPPHPCTNKVDSVTTNRVASIFDAFDPPSRSGEPSNSEPELIKAEDDAAEEVLPDLPSVNGSTSLPASWTEWKQHLLIQSSAKRFIREVASAVAQYQGDLLEPQISHFYANSVSLIPPSASGVLQMTCDAKQLLNLVSRALKGLTTVGNLPRHYVIDAALRLLGSGYHQRRILIMSVLHALIGYEDLAEDVVRVAAHDMLRVCHALAVSSDDLARQRKTKAYVASQFLRRHAAHASWQLETCLWLHRGSGLPLSGVALKEAIVAVRVGLLVASWNRSPQCIEAMIRSDPDCYMDEEAGRHLWASLRSNISTVSGEPKEKNKVSSGGWEFLVDCKRSEATGMLNDKKTGCFIIRPHPGDSGVFTLSFKTNLAPKAEESDRTIEDQGNEVSGDDLTDNEAVATTTKSKAKKSRSNQSVQHAIVRLSESGYRCGSFGPHTTLISLLEAVSASLPFALRFDLPPTNRVIKEEGSQPSPNAVFLRKLALSHADSIMSTAPDSTLQSTRARLAEHKILHHGFGDRVGSASSIPDEKTISFGKFLELLVLTTARKQFCNVAAAEYKDILSADDVDGDDTESKEEGRANDLAWQTLSWRAIEHDGLTQNSLMVAQRILRPILSWCRMLEVTTAHAVASSLSLWSATASNIPLDDSRNKPWIETLSRRVDGGDAILRKMIQRDSGVHFSTLKLVDGGDNTLVVIFSQDDAIKWLIDNNVDDSAELAASRLKHMEEDRIIESVDLSSLRLKQRVNSQVQEGTRYRILDPWEVEALHNWEGETLGASLGRERFSGFNLARVGLASEGVFRSLGGVKLLELWTCTKGGVVLTKAVAAIHPVWESCGGGDLQFKNGVVAEPQPFENTIRQHLLRNALFRRLDMPQRFLAIVQVELLDLKNLTAPGGLLSMSVYALLRLRREGSNAELTNKSRTLDTSVTHPVKLGKSSGPNAPASWGSVVRFRFPLPEDAWVDGSSIDNDREVLFKGAPRLLQVSVYERKLLVDHSLGTADIRTDGLCAGGQLEEWVPLRNDKNGITWFARVRLTLRFELMCLASPDERRDLEAVAPSVGLRKIKELSRTGGGSHEEMRRAVSSPDLVITYFDAMH